ncbi:hypothetical protein H2248_011287 [Termitomyces sp. 'cryptogamus']|nr:hypothetical protein H2248_011287 [Termitomyces sp. 'cryptogamus']
MRILSVVLTILLASFSLAYDGYISLDRCPSNRRRCCKGSDDKITLDNGDVYRELKKLRRITAQEDKAVYAFLVPFKELSLIPYPAGAALVSKDGIDRDAYLMRVNSAVTPRAVPGLHGD